MFDQITTQPSLDKDSFEARATKLRRELLECQFAMVETGYPVLIVVAGLDGAGKGVLVHRLNEWMDPRGIETNTFWDPSDEEEEHPFFWRFWRQLPDRGRIGIFLGSWYRRPIQLRVDEEINESSFETAAERIRVFERQLSDDGAVVIKLWLHVSEKTQRRQLEEKAPREEQNPRISDRPYELRGKYEPTLRASEELVRRTQTLQCPWHIIDGEERYSREIAAGEIILAALRQRLQQSAPPTPPPELPPPNDHLAAVPLHKSLKRDEYREKLEHYQARLQDLAWRAYREKRSLVALFEGWDAAGKGSAIRRVTGAIDPRLYKLVQIAAPSDEESAHHYLWRFWRRLQRDGRATLFDRSWYGRVLVERVEGFASPAEWQRAYAEINEMERELSDHGAIVAKFWLHISPEEQLARFRARELEPHKQYKITSEDWRNRDKWPAYEAAVNQMVSLTDMPNAPWYLIPGNDKRYARVRILKLLCRQLEEALG
ncbi:polyphosphate:AMP phosphotransferase [Mangrovimicrobium sediminis]|uniref:Polyphosphate:AMP phosphotransferase n=1 Tax=Mangrovimicrobium sediminis TaxID=2562682 RepID=A0A4Z0LW97_9GAMM|nr:polyphosphate:AMP phosphotransferase [Haliea sp. SAOS-164]TGD71418.1 polyphosphate:AMP phosphotransferase [Haliea sp. SAOS-164]